MRKDPGAVMAVLPADHLIGDSFAFRRTLKAASKVAQYLILVPFYTLWRYIVQVYGIITNKGAGGRFTEEFSHLKLLLAVLKACSGAVAGLPAMFSKRREIQVKRKAQAGEIRGLFKNHGISATELVLKD
jgi:hypothetical protein